jgi:hypothetical protein
VHPKTSGWIRIHYSAVSIQRFPQDRYINWRSNFQVVVDTTGQNNYAVVRAARTRKPMIRAAPPARFHVVGPSLVRAGKTVAVRFAALDYCDNRAVPPPEGDVFAASQDDPFKPLARLSARFRKYCDASSSRPRRRPRPRIAMLSTSEDEDEDENENTSPDLRS